MVSLLSSLHKTGGLGLVLGCFGAELTVFSDGLVSVQRKVGA